MRKLLPKCNSVLVFIILSLPVLLPAQEAQYYYDLGIKLRHDGKIIESIEALKKAVAEDRKFADAYNELAKSYLQKPNANRSIKQAFDAITNARRLNINNKEYVYTLADINFAKGVMFDAKLWINRLLKDDPNDVKALKRLAEYSLKQNKVFEWNSINPGSKSNRFLQQAASIMEIYNRILEIAPDDIETISNLSLIYFDAGDIDRFIEYQERILEINSYNKNCLLYLGLAYGELGDHETAARYYDNAIALMDDEERAAIEDRELLEATIDVNIFGNYKLIAAADTTNFWYRKDPFYLTDINERKYIHYGRFAEANLRFTARRNSLPGWKSARGLIWIKYGRPLSRRVKYVQNFREFMFHEKWRYRNFEFRFRAGMYSGWKGKFDFELRVLALAIPAFFAPTKKDLNPGGYLEEAISELPDFYEYKPLGVNVPLPVDVVTFRGKNNKTEAVAYFGIPVNKIKWSSQGGMFSGVIKHGVYVHDKDWNKLVDNVITEYPSFPSTDLDTSSTQLIISSNRFEIEPGSYNLSVEFTEPNSGNAGVTRDTLLVQEYNNYELQMSDILIASSINVHDALKPLSRDNLQIYAGPQHLFYANEPLYIYYEVYNLFSDFRRYTMEYSFRPLDKVLWDEIQKVRILRNLPVLPLTGDEHWVSSVFQSSGNTDYQILEIDPNIDDSGVYELIVRLTDQETGKSTMKSTVVGILEKK